MHTFRIRVAIVASLGLAALSYGACSGGDKPPVLQSDGTGGRTGGTGGTSTGGSGGQDASVSTTGGSAGAAGQDAGPPPNCGTLTCRGHSRCDAGPPAQCKCDPGYVTEVGDATNCVVDTTCINIRPLEDHCRVVVGGAHAIASFFAVEYCSGTAVLPATLAQLGDADAGGGGAAGAAPDVSSAFKIQENGVNVSTENFKGIYPRDVESYLTVAIDISASLSGDAAGKARLAQLSGDLRTHLIDHLSQQGEAPVGVSVLVFGARVVELVPWTTDKAAVEAGLDRLSTDLPALAAQVYSGSTALFNATYAAIDGTQRIRQLRADVTEDGVLTTGTVVVISDGEDTSLTQPDPSRVTSTPINVISVGLSASVTRDYLDQLGPSGSFLAPTQQDWQAAFDEIATRIEQYPKRSYLLAYCSPAALGTTPTVTIGLNRVTAKTTASCGFDTRLFRQTNPPACDATFFENACTNVSCGGFLACRACASAQQCCASGTCSDPTPAANCRGQDELCGVSSPRLNCSTGNVCAAPAAVGDACGACEDGVGYCSGAVCLATKSVGAECTGAAECSSLNCVSLNPTREPAYCQPREARMFEECRTTGASAICEPGSNCTVNNCKGRAAIGHCDLDTDCLSGSCDTTVRQCLLATTCHWNWASKMGGL